MKLLLIFPHQLFKEHPLLDGADHIILIEEPRYFTDFAFHQQKLVLHRASMKEYAQHLKKNKYSVTYIECHEASKLPAWIKAHAIKEIICIDPVDNKLEKQLTALCAKAKCAITISPSPSFLTPIDWFNKLFKGKKHFSHASFYQAQRKRLGILIDSNKKPVGGKWSFDTENRKRLPSVRIVPKAPHARHTASIKEAITYVEKHFAKNPGSAKEFWLPVSFEKAEEWFEQFLDERFKHFGDYEDAIEPDHPIMFHSVLSPLINCGLLMPDTIIKTTLAYAKKHHITINNLEGFVRQIIGWREFVYCLYKTHGEEQRNGNFFKHTGKITQSFYTGTTGIEPLDDAIQSTIAHSYSHHIIRLMILGNFLLLTGTDPHEVYRWFMELYLDAYDWVMVPNVYGMSQYADGGLMTTKPYIAGSNYILAMSSYKKGAWCETWNALYWYFIIKHEKVIAKNPRLNIMARYANRLKKETREKMLNDAEQFLKKWR